MSVAWRTAKTKPRLALTALRQSRARLHKLWRLSKRLRDQSITNFFKPPPRRGRPAGTTREETRGRPAAAASTHIRAGNALCLYRSWSVMRVCVCARDVSVHVSCIELQIQACKQVCTIYNCRPKTTCSDHCIHCNVSLVRLLTPKVVPCTSFLHITLPGYFSFDSILTCTGTSS